MTKSPARSLLLGGSVVALCGLSAWMGAALGKPSGAAQPKSSSREAELSSYIDQQDRRIENLERKMEAAETNAQSALNQVDELRTLLSQQRPLAVGAPAPGTDLRPSGAGTAPENAARQLTPAEALQQGRQRMLEMSPALVKHELGIVADQSVEGGENRKIRAAAEAQSTARILGVAPEGEMKMREIFTEQMEAAHREIGPLYRDGLEKQDPAILAEKMKTLWADTDRRMKDVLDAEQLRSWESLAGVTRERVLYTFDQLKK